MSPVGTTSKQTYSKESSKRPTHVRNHTAGQLQKQHQTLPAPYKEVERASGHDTTPVAGSTQGHTAFEDYMGKVIASVQHRKRNPRLKSLFNQGSHQYSHEPVDAAGATIGDYVTVARVGKEESQLAAVANVS